jgi:hypothetical protein
MVSFENGSTEFSGDLAFVRRNPDGAPTDLALCGARSLKVGDWTLEFKPDTEFVELRLENGRVLLRSGAKDAVVSVKKDGKAVRLQTRP